MVHHLIGQRATVTATTRGFVDGQRAVAFPGNTYAFVKAFDAERFACQQEALAIAGDHFVQREHVVLAIHFDQIALETLAAFMERNDQGIVALLQHSQMTGDFQRGREHLWWLRSIFRV
ncbi:hypothetical protein D3C80_1744330 [compost metagenome]